MESNNNDVVQKIFADHIDEPPHAMRVELDRDGLWELADDIKKNGLINPITVRPKGDRYEVVAGHRRFNACRIAGVLQIPCVVRLLDDAQTFSVMASENLVREDVNPVDEAQFILRMMQQTSQGIKEIAQNIRRSEQYVLDRLAVAEMPAYLQDALRTKSIKLGAALELTQISDESTRALWVGIAVRDGVSVGQARAWRAQWEANQLPVGSEPQDPPAGDFSSAPQVFRMKCAIDGCEYPASEMRAVMVHITNVPILDGVREQLVADALAQKNGGGSDDARAGNER